jgi:hypothetical protein
MVGAVMRTVRTVPETWPPDYSLWANSDRCLYHQVVKL